MCITCERKLHRRPKIKQEKYTALARTQDKFLQKIILSFPTSSMTGQEVTSQTQ